MKRNLLFSILLLMSALVIGQVNMTRDEGYNNHHPEMDFSLVNPNPLLHGGNGNNRGPEIYKNLGSSANVYSILLAGQNQVMYNSDINSLVFVHRKNDANNSGVLMFDVSTDGGSTWANDVGPLTPTIQGGTAPTTGARYPSGTIYNPSGNTNPANAYVVGAGPALGSATTWGYLFYCSGKFDGTTNISEQYSLDPGNPSAFHPYGLWMTPQGTAFALSTLYDNATPIIDTGALGTYGSFFVHRGIFNAANNNFLWTVTDTIVPDHYIIKYSTGDQANWINTWNIAFSPDGNTGYIVIIGAERGGTDTVPKPIVYKTTNQGTSWSKLPDFAFGSLPAFDTTLINSGAGNVRPWFSNADINVDKNGRLHVFAEVQGQARVHPDSVTYTWTHNPSAGTYTRFLYDVHTSNGSDWQAIFVDTVFTTYGTFVAGSSNIRIDARPQLARSQDGSQVFFSWIDTDPVFAGIFTNDLPDVRARGYDVDSNTITYRKDFTAGSGLYHGLGYFSTISPLAITNGNTFDHELPIVFAEPTGDGLQPIYYHYIQAAGFDSEDFGASGPINIGLQEKGSENIQVFPNPTSGILFIHVDKPYTKVKLTVFDILGNEVIQKVAAEGNIQIDLGKLNAGIFFIQLENEGKLFTKKIILSK